MTEKNTEKKQADNSTPSIDQTRRITDISFDFFDDLPEESEQSVKARKDRPKEELAFTKRMRMISEELEAESQSQQQESEHKLSRKERRLKKRLEKQQKKEEKRQAAANANGQEKGSRAASNENKEKRKSQKSSAELFDEQALQPEKKSRFGRKKKTEKQEKPAEKKPDRLTIWWENTRKRYQEKMAARSHFGPVCTVLLTVLLLMMVSGFWALFVSGPARIHDEKTAQVQARISEQVPDIMGVSETVFDYITYEGYTTSTLYWFDVTGEMITSRDIKTLNYEAAKQTALNDYGVETQTIQLAYGYSAPVYEIQSEDHFLLLDYDSLALVYERRDIS